MHCRLTVIILSLAVAFAMPAAADAQQGERPLILTTTTDLESITRKITGERAEVRSIAAGTEDPHFLTARPSFVVMARDADAWIRVGMELEIGWEGPILRDSRNRQIQVGAPGHIDASEGIIPLDVPERRVTRDMGDVHAHGNPHYLLDPLNVRIAAGTIASRLSTLFPQHADAFQDNLANFRNTLDRRMFGNALVDHYGGARLWTLEVEDMLFRTLEADGMSADLGGWYGRLAPHSGRPVVTYHRTWTYLLNRFGLDDPIELEPKPGIPPTSRHLARVVEIVREQDIRVILHEPFYSRRAADLVAERTGAQVLLVNDTPTALEGKAHASNHLDLIDLAVNGLADAMETQ